MTENFYAKELDEIYQEFKTDPDKGLSDTEAKKRLELYGPNEIPRVSRGFIKIYLAPLFNWLIVIYLFCSLFMFIGILFGEEGSMSVIVLTLAIVGINCFIAIFQQFRATKKLKALRELAAPTATIIRDGQKQEIPTKELVVGDILIIDQGDKIPADARIINSTNLEVNEASLTGESEPVKKVEVGNPIKGEHISIGERSNMVFLGTYVTTGNGKAVIVATGGNTEIGKISHGLEEAGTSSVPVREKMNHFGMYLGLVILALWFVILIFKWITTGDPHFVGSLNAALDLMPINLPLLVTIILLTGVLVMAREGVIVRNIASVDSLGRVSVVCSDKTGTLTQNQMCVQNIWANGKEFKVTGFGYNPKGEIIDINHSKELIPVKNVNDYPYLKLLLTAGFLNNNSALVKSDVDIKTKKGPKHKWTVVGSPTEGALVVLFKKAMRDSEVSDYELIREFPFDSRVKRMSKVFKKDGEYISFTKGASEVLIPLCSKIIYDNKEQPFTEELKNLVYNKVNEYASKGYRILSLSYKKLGDREITSEEDREFCESDMIYIGFVTILDPPREGVKESVLQCYSAGIDVVMITGDSPTTARAIAEQIAIIKREDEKAIEGKDIKYYQNSEEFNKIKVFARVSPEHKQDIIKEYQKQERVVAMTGDGVNDALALNMADVGIAMGITGTDVAKEASDMIISDDSFNSIVKGIHQGRGIFAKIRAVVFFYICINVFEGLVAFILAVVLEYPWWTDPASPYYMQWIFLSLTLHTLPGLILTFDIISKDVMNEKPKDSEEILAKNTIYLMFVYGGLLAASMIIIYFLPLTGIWPVFKENIEHGALNAGYLYTKETANLIPAAVELNEAKALTMLMTVLYICESFLIFQIRRPNKNVIKQFIEDSSKFMYILIGLLYFAFLALMYIPGTQVTLAAMGLNFMFMYLTIWDWLVCILVSLITIGGLEIYKYIARKKGITF
ncbi:MAG: cation-translocating P-type ATPase [Promethearchaeota archaeon]